MAGPDVEGLPLTLALEHTERRRPELEAGAALEEDEKLLVGRVAVGRRTVVARLQAARWSIWLCGRIS